MATTTLLPREEFLENNITFNVRRVRGAECSICYEKLDCQKHIPMGFKGPGTCKHVFGASCIYTWLASNQPGANTCPLCRTVLFEQDETTFLSDDESDSEYDAALEDQYIGARENDVLDYSYPSNLMINLTYWYEATTFLTYFWRNLEVWTFSDWVPLDEDIEECIVEAAEKMHASYIVRRADLPEFIGIAKRIMWRQMKLGEGFRLEEIELVKWVERMTEKGLWSV